MSQSKVLSYADNELTIHGEETDQFFQITEDFLNADFFNSIGSQFLSEESVFLDVGANLGLTSIMAARFASKGSIFCFEP